MGRLQHVLGWVFLLALSAMSAHAQPFIFYRGIVNAASFAPQGLPNGSIARGSIFSIFGRSFGPAQAATVSSFPLDTTFQGVGVRVCQDGDCIEAIPLFVSAGQVNAIMPSNAPLGPVSIRVVFNGQGGYYASAEVVASSVGIFAINSGGFGPGVVQNFTPEALPVNSTQASARPGQTVIAWGTGLGAGLNADNVAPQSGDLPVNVEIWAGGKPVTVKRYSGRSPCCAGVDQIIFDLPPDTPTGCYVPIQMRTGGQVVSNSISIAVSADGGACSDAWNPLSAMWRQGGSRGLVIGHRVNGIFNDLTGQTAEGTVDLGVALFRNEEGGPYAYQAMASLPPPGSCTVHAVGGDLHSGASLPTFGPAPGDLDAGASIDFGGVSLAKPPAGIYYGQLALSGLPPRDSVLHAPVAVSGAGGAGVGAFSVQLPAAPAIQWTNRTASNTLDRSSGLNVSWEGGIGEGDLVLIAGFNTNVPQNSSAAFVCTAPLGASSFRVPGEILRALPPSPQRAAPSHLFGYAMVGLLPLSKRVATAATGLDTGAAVTMSWSARTLVYR